MSSTSAALSRLLAPHASPRRASSLRVALVAPAAAALVTPSRRVSALAAASAWREPSRSSPIATFPRADDASRRPGARGVAVVAAGARGGGGGRAVSSGKSARPGTGSSRGAAASARPGRKGVGPPARRGGKKKRAEGASGTGATRAPADERVPLEAVASELAAEELSAFNDDDTGDYDPRRRRAQREAAAAAAADEEEEEDDFRESSSAMDASGAGAAGEEDEFVFIEDPEEGADDAVGDEDEDDGLYLTDADDGLTRRTAQQAKGATVRSCRYLQSCVKVSDCPPPKHPEIAVIGRSNVGKSSLINMLTNRKEVAKTSKNPGKTQTINHFEMVTGDGTWYLTDLPGYGFANAPERARKQWALFTREYLLERENLLAVMLLIDSTIKPQVLDLECLEFLGENDIPVTIVFTKVDKKRKIKAGKRARPEENVEAFCREVSEYWEEMPPMIFTSSKTGDGKQSVLNHVATLRQFFKEGQR